MERAGYMEAARSRAHAKQTSHRHSNGRQARHINSGRLLRRHLAGFYTAVDIRAGPDPETDGVVRWRRIDLKRKIEERFGVTMHERTVGKQLASLGFRRLSARPQHPKSDPDAQEAFKKTSPQR